jgi:decaprenylphospho-beta-D-erythro-pentofuranosid-2-ulose 2-reductase
VNVKDALGAVQSVLVLGGGSDIARATCLALVEHRQARVVLAARKPEGLGESVAALEASGAGLVETVAFDATDFASHTGFVTDVFDRFGDFDVVLVTFGVLGDQARAEADGAAAVEIVETNFTGVVSVTVPLARRLEQQGHGTLVLLSSVAGERARRSNFVYGSSKAGVDAFYQGLGDALTGTGVRVMIVRPGFVVTKMTEGLPPAPLSTTPEAVAAAIVRGLEKGRETVWVPAALRFVMSGLRHLPRSLFRRLKI